METKRLSLEDFKVKSFASNEVESLEKISGGILGACHDDGTCQPIKDIKIYWPPHQN
jgi:hypothetical protein